MGAELAENFFHQGATNYVFSKTQEARQAVKAGLKLFPTNRELIELDKLLNQQEQQDQQNQDQQNDSPQDSKDQQEQKDSKQDEQKKPQPEPQQDSKKPDDSQAKNGSAEKDKQEAESQPGEKPKDEADQAGQDPAQAARMAPLQMTPQQAEQLLDAHKGEERLLLFTPQLSRTNRSTRPVKDW